MTINTSPVDNDNLEASLDSSETQTIPESTLVSTLEKERKLRAEYEKKWKASQAKEKEYETQLQQLATVDPAKYQEMLRQEEQRREQDMINKRQFETLKSESLQKIDLAIKEKETYRERYDQLLVEQEFKSAFYEQGGRRLTLGALDGETIAPVDTALASLRPRIRVNEGEVEILDRNGDPELMPDGKKKTLAVKLEELKKTSWGYLFQPEGGASGSGSFTSSPRKAGGTSVVSVEAARQGKVSMADIAAGKTQVI